MSGVRTDHDRGFRIDHNRKGTIMSEHNPPESGAFGTPPPNDPTGRVPQPPSTPPPPQSPWEGASTVATSSTGFLPALFDFTFTNFVTPMLVKFVYLLVTIALAIGGIAWIIAGFTQSVGLGILALILVPIGFIIYLALVRMTLEFYLSVVRMSQDIHHRLPQA